MTKTEIHRAQVRLEDESRAISSVRYRGKRNAPWVDAVGPVADEGALPPGRRLIRKFLKPTSEAISLAIQATSSGKAGRKHSAVKLLEGAAPEALAYLTLRCAIQAAVQQQSLAQTARSIAKAVQDHLSWSKLEEVNPQAAKGLRASSERRKRASLKRQASIRGVLDKEGVRVVWSMNEQVQVGTKLIELAEDATRLFKIERISESKSGKLRMLWRLELGDGALSWLEAKHAESELLDPLPLPMVCQPKPWTSSHDGGYLTIDKPLVRNRSRPYQEELENTELSEVFSAVNHIQDTPWQINKSVLEVMDTIWTEGGSLGGLPPKELLPVPPKPVDFEHNEEAKQNWKKSASEVHAANATLSSRRGALASKLWVARKLVDSDTIFFPHQLDFRGRVYPMATAGPHPQDSDPGKALLRFALGKPLGPEGVRWLAIHVANLFGQDKVSFEDRLAWVDENSPAIMDSGSNPLDGQRFWTTADKPWMALAACLEWVGLSQQGEEYVSHLPIAVDGSNSGLQHLTALLQDLKAAPHVNLTPAAKPGDIYAILAVQAQSIVDEGNDPKLTPWKGGKITRAIVKQPCMTYAYSVTARGMGEQVLNSLKKLDETNGDQGMDPYLDGADNFLAANALGLLLYKLIGQVIPSAGHAMSWFRGAAKAINEIDLPVWWATAVGLPVMQRYPKPSPKSVEVTFRGQRVQLSVNDERDIGLADWLENASVRAFDTRRVSNSLAANFIHSLDAAHLMMTVLACKASGIDCLAVIHDSFATYAADMDKLSSTLRETFVSLYENDPIAKFHGELQEQLAGNRKAMEKIPPLPAKGDFDLRQALEATYMFS